MSHSSGGRSSGKGGIFSRTKLHKVVPFSSTAPQSGRAHPPPSDDERYSMVDSSAKSVRSSHSRHSFSSQREGLNRHQAKQPSYGEEHSIGLNYSAGVITTIPYDSVGMELNQPITGDRPVSRGDEVREMQPHHIAQMGDFHQYPTFDNVTPDGQKYSQVPAQRNTGRQGSYAHSTMSSRNGRVYFSFLFLEIVCLQRLQITCRYILPFLQQHETPSYHLPQPSQT